MANKPRPTTSDVAADLHAHEVRCEERWKTIFNETADIKEEIAAINKTIKGGTLALLSFAGALIIALISGVLPLQ